MIPSKIFISYRREDSRYQARMIYDALAQVVSGDNVFMDINSIPAGADFVEILEGWVNQCDIMLVLIGPGWITAADQKDDLPRLQNPNDFVRIEVRKALSRGISVVPVLIDGAKIPQENQLPEDMKGLARRQGEIAEYRTFSGDIERLVKKLSLVPQAARPTLETILRDAQLIRDGSYRTTALASIAAALTELGRGPEALQVADLADDSAPVFMRIANMQIKAGMTAEAAASLEKAGEGARSIVDGWQQVGQLRQVGKMQARAGLASAAHTTFQWALDSASSVEDDYTRASRLKDVAQALAEAGMIDRALQVASLVEKASYRASALASIAVIQAKAGMLSKAAGTFSKALEIAKAIDIESTQSSTFASIAEAQAVAGMKSEAAATIEKALQIAQSVEHVSRSRTFSDIVEAQTTAGRFKEALQLVRSVGPDFEDGARYSISKGQATARMFREAHEVALSIRDDALRAGALREVAGALATAGMMKEASNVAASIKSDLQRAQAFVLLASNQSKTTEMKNDAGTILEQARIASQAIGDESVRPFMILQVVAMQAGLWSNAIPT